MATSRDGSLQLAAGEQQLFQCRRDQELLRIRLVGNLQHIGFAADLTVFDVALYPASRLVH
jgi:hypothetical protein